VNKTARQMATIPAVVAREDTECYLENLKKLLVQFKVPAAEWKQILSAKITSEARQYVVEHLADTTSTFQDIRNALLQCVGQTATKATALYFDQQSPSADVAVSMVALNRVDKWVSILCKGAKTMEEMKNRMVVAKVTSRLEPGLKEFLATKRVTTRQKMGALIGEWHAIHGSQPAKKVVDLRDITGVIICARCANGTPMPLEEAKVKLSVGGMELSRRVGVAPSRLIRGTGLLSFDLDSEEQWKELAVLRQTKTEEEDSLSEDKGVVPKSVIVSVESNVEDDECPEDENSVVDVYA